MSDSLVFPCSLAFSDSEIAQHANVEQMLGGCFRKWRERKSKVRCEVGFPVSLALSVIIFMNFLASKEEICLKSPCIITQVIYLRFLICLFLRRFSYISLFPVSESLGKSWPRIIYVFFKMFFMGHCDLRSLRM